MPSRFYNLVGKEFVTIIIIIMFTFSWEWPFGFFSSPRVLEKPEESNLQLTPRVVVLGFIKESDDNKKRLKRFFAHYLLGRVGKYSSAETRISEEGIDVRK